MIERIYAPFEPFFIFLSELTEPSFHFIKPSHCHIVRAELFSYV